MIAIGSGASALNSFEYLLPIISTVSCLDPTYNTDFGKVHSNLPDFFKQFPETHFSSHFPYFLKEFGNMHIQPERFDDDWLEYRSPPLFKVAVKMYPNKFLY